MKNSTHYKHRCASRAFSEGFAEIALEYGDYIEQKGGSCVLAIRDPALVKNLKHSFATLEQELLHKKRLLRKRRKALGMEIIKSAQQFIELEESERDVMRALRLARKKKRAIKCGYVVFGKKLPGSELTAITVAHPTRSIKGIKTINE